MPANENTSINSNANSTSFGSLLKDTANRKNNIFDLITGNSLVRENNACPPGTYGFDCQSQRPMECSSVCDHTTGKVFIHKVCPAGYTGLNCSDICLPGLYGVECQTKCPLECSVTCDHTTGKCPDQRENPLTSMLGEEYVSCNTKTTTDLFESLSKGNANDAHYYMNTSTETSPTTSHDVKKTNNIYLTIIIVIICLGSVSVILLLILLIFHLIRALRKEETPHVPDENPPSPAHPLYESINEDFVVPSIPVRSVE
ncbi:multiple epidermal growth factor-like domains protein 11 isoform X2 [Ostrea edulis]|uniref:multiple epidermal growth factor-like domains protein 11 isoform X2 n=1 Tax=Ostrea edulis TaxID=37623 RepID=UPI0024AF9BB1|nr:multiple epidermal growth factor-like domains protein 11 isoform X2 [Ostrea edulis]